MSQVDPSKVHVYPMSYQSGDMLLPEWITLFTLCLAPLMAHIIAGAPQPSYLCNHRPKWYDRIGHYNPTSILWRYAAITDRRIRTSRWDRATMAATNALFWTSRGWDGSETMVDWSTRYCTHLPEHARIAIFSWEMVKTTIVTFQGIQTISLLVSFFTSQSGTSQTFAGFTSLDIIFSPLTLLGLLRLPCSLWLIDDYAYSSLHIIDSDCWPPQPRRLSTIRSSLDSLLERPTTPTMYRFGSSSLWVSRLFRAVFMCPLLGFWAMAVLILMMGSEFTVTDIVMLTFYLTFFTITISIFAFYFVCDRTTTTIIPCVSSLWYRIYTGLVMVFGMTLVVVSAVETRKTVCGKYTSNPKLDGDFAVCNTRQVTVYSIGPSEDYFGLASPLWLGTAEKGNHTQLHRNESWIYNFTGNCLGKRTSDYAHRVIFEATEKLRDNI